MNRLKQLWVWTRRMAHCRGFGIQNPDDYRFVRYVVNEHRPYHAYEQLPHSADSITAKLGRFYLRLANSVQPKTVVDLVNMGLFFKAGCHKAEITTAKPEKAIEGGNTIIIAEAASFDSALLSCCNKDTVLVVHNLWKQKTLWTELTANDNKATTAFNLYYCAVLFFSERLSRQRYIVNF
ncbi:MAG: hypothetical protein IJT98_08255 [Prevotella sp.]|nr:hypothetical protein [Prevotella sp.]